MDPEQEESVSRVWLSHMEAGNQEIDCLSPSGPVHPGKGGRIP